MSRYFNDELYHHGIIGQKWGRRRFQNKDGSLTPEGKMRYLDSDSDVTRRTKQDWNDLSEDEFRGKHAISKKEYLNRVNKYGDPYAKSAGRKMHRKVAGAFTNAVANTMDHPDQKRIDSAADIMTDVYATKEAEWLGNTHKKLKDYEKTDQAKRRAALNAAGLVGSTAYWAHDSKKRSENPKDSEKAEIDNLYKKLDKAEKSGDWKKAEDLEFTIGDKQKKYQANWDESYEPGSNDWGSQRYYNSGSNNTMSKNDKMKAYQKDKRKLESLYKKYNQTKDKKYAKEYIELDDHIAKKYSRDYWDN